MVTHHDPAAVGAKVHSPRETQTQNGLAAAQLPYVKRGWLQLMINRGQEFAIRTEFQVIGMRSGSLQAHNLPVIFDRADADVAVNVAPGIALDLGIKSQALGPGRVAVPGFRQPEISQRQAGDGFIA